MWRRSAAAGFLLAVVLAVGLVAGGPVAAATELTLSPASGPPGSEFVVTGTGFAALPVEIRWGGVSGPVIATAIGPAFSVTAVVPDSPPNSHPVMAVVTDGASVSTSSASFQVTSGGAPPPVPEDTTTSTSPSTSTTIAQPPTTAPPTTVPAVETGRPAASAPSAGRGGLSGGVDGGVEDTTGGAVSTPAAATGTPSAATSAGAGPTAASTPAGGLAPAPGPAQAGDATVPTITVPPGGVPGPAPTGGQGTATAPLSPDDGVTAAALAPARTNQSAGAVSNPLLLFLGLALVFGGGVFLAVRNRHRV